MAASKPAKRARRPAEADARTTDGRHLRRARTEEKLVQAAGKLLRRGGVAALGVNAVAEEAGVEKVLVYRYFGGIEGLMETYAMRSDFWPTLAELIGEAGEVVDVDEPARTAGRILANYARALRKRPVTLDLLAWECANRNPLTAALEKVREERALELDRALAAHGLRLSPSAAGLGALLAAAMNYLAVRSRDIRVFGGLPVGTDADWDRIEELITGIYGAMAAAEAKPSRL